MYVCNIYAPKLQRVRRAGGRGARGGRAFLRIGREAEGRGAGSLAASRAPAPRRCCRRPCGAGCEQGKGWHRAPGTPPAPRGLLSAAVRALAGEGREPLPRRALPPPSREVTLFAELPRRPGWDPRQPRPLVPRIPPAVLSVTGQHREGSSRGKAVRAFLDSFPLAQPREGVMEEEELPFVVGED